MAGAQYLTVNAIVADSILKEVGEVFIFIFSGNKRKEISRKRLPAQDIDIN